MPSLLNVIDMETYNVTYNHISGQIREAVSNNKKFKVCRFETGKGNDRKVEFNGKFWKPTTITLTTCSTLRDLF